MVNSHFGMDEQYDLRNLNEAYKYWSSFEKYYEMIGMGGIRLYSSYVMHIN